MTVRTVARTVGALGLLGAALPLNLAVTGVALARTAVSGGPASADGQAQKTILISGGKMTKSLALARAFHAAGHRVVLVETARYRLTGHRFSRAVDRFHVVPDATDPDSAAALLGIVQAEGVDVYVPVCSPVASRYDALAAEVLADHCEVVHVAADAIDGLDDKFRFARAAEQLVEGQEYCTHGLVRDGNLQVWACCKSSPFQVNYEMVDKPEVEAWVRRFVEAHELTGQVSFDLMGDPGR